MNKKTYLLEGLCCPNCAAEIDKKVKGLADVREAFVDFPKTLLTVAFEGDESALFARVVEIARGVDKDISVKAL